MERSAFCCKIAFVGTSCTGKTTLLEEIRVRFEADRTAVSGGDNRPAVSGGDNRPAVSGGDNRPAVSGGDKRPAVFVQEAARLFFILNPLVRERFSAQTQGQVQALALQQEQEAHASGARLLFCDRSVVDAVPYLRAEGDRTGARELFERIRFWLPTYTAFALLNPDDIPYQADGIRQEDELARQRFHSAFLDFFREERLAYTLLIGTLEERIVQCNQLLAAAGSQVLIPLRSTQPS